MSTPDKSRLSAADAAEIAALMHLLEVKLSQFAACSPDEVNEVQT